MNQGARLGSILTWLATLAFVAAAVYAPLAGDSSASAAEPIAQDIMRVESRISQLEQRFRSVELSISRLEQQSRLSGLTTAPTAPSRDPEAGLLRAEVEALRRRLAEAECGLIRIDERTLAPAAREQRRKSVAAGTDPCRLNTNDPLNLSIRP